MSSQNISQNSERKVGTASGRSLAMWELLPHGALLNCAKGAMQRSGKSPQHQERRLLGDALVEGLKAKEAANSGGAREVF